MHKKAYFVLYHMLFLLSEEEYNLTSLAKIIGESKQNTLFHLKKAQKKGLVNQHRDTNFWFVLPKGLGSIRLLKAFVKSKKRIPKKYIGKRRFHAFKVNGKLGTKLDTRQIIERNGAIFENSVYQATYGIVVCEDNFVATSKKLGLATYTFDYSEVYSIFDEIINKINKETPFKIKTYECEMEVAELLDQKDIIQDAENNEGYLSEYYWYDNSWDFLEREFRTEFKDV
ncbi:MAG: helix-turn-helix domain-containing protein [Candidatus Aenigmatarchaeota archaeon]